MKWCIRRTTLQEMEGSFTDFLAAAQMGSDEFFDMVESRYGLGGDAGEFLRKVRAAMGDPMFFDDTDLIQTGDKVITVVGMSAADEDKITEMVVDYWRMQSSG